MALAAPDEDLLIAAVLLPEGEPQGLGELVADPVPPHLLADPLRLPLGDVEGDRVCDGEAVKDGDPVLVCDKRGEFVATLVRVELLLPDPVIEVVLVGEGEGVIEAHLLTEGEPEGEREGEGEALLQPEKDHRVARPEAEGETVEELDLHPDPLPLEVGEGAADFVGDAESEGDFVPDAQLLAHPLREGERV